MSSSQDPEKDGAVSFVEEKKSSGVIVEELTSGESGPTRFQSLTKFLQRWGVETHGIEPIPLERRTDTRLYQMFFVWFSANFNILAFGTGSVGPVFYHLGLRDALLVILVATIITSAMPAYFSIFGPKLGTRAMVHARYSWGFYGAMIPAILNVFTMQSFLILNTIIGGQTLASVSSHLNATLGIVIISILTLIVMFLGYRVLHWYEAVVWLPSLVAFLVMLGVGAKKIESVPTPPPNAAAILSFSSIVVVYIIAWSPVTPDYGVYHADASSWRIFTYVYLGLVIGSIPSFMLGAAFAAGASSVPSWQEGLGNGSNVGGLVGAILAEAGGFGKFLTVMVALTVPSACAPTMYSFGTSFMTVWPLLARVPRYLYGFVATAVLIPVGVIGATRFYNTFVDLLSIIGYWCAPYNVIIIADHAFIRRHNWTTYDVVNWNDPRRLPLGAAAVAAFACGIGMVVPCISQVWYIGPIAKMGTGDIGLYTGAAVALVVYLPLRVMERRWEKRVGRGER
ncbi:cytosine-purine permease [Amylostereum chailletii]|nr:cytosine-purine permease [Amylostereum chailletii]